MTTISQFFFSQITRRLPISGQHSSRRFMIHILETYNPCGGCRCRKPRLLVLDHCLSLPQDVLKRLALSPSPISITLYIRRYFYLSHSLSHSHKASQLLWRRWTDSLFLSLSIMGRLSPCNLSSILFYARSRQCSRDSVENPARSQSKSWTHLTIEMIKTVVFR